MARRRSRTCGSSLSDPVFLKNRGRQPAVNTPWGGAAAALSPPLLDAGELARARLLVVDGHAARDLDALRLRRAGAVQALGEIADGVAADGHVLDQPQHAHAVDGIDAVSALQKLADQRTDLVVLQVLLRRHGDDEAAGDVLRQPGDLEGE